jgi:hypothetical protein
MEGDGRTKIKYTNSRDTLRNPLNIGLENNNKRQDHKIGTVCVGEDTCRRGEGERRIP